MHPGILLPKRNGNRRVFRNASVSHNRMNATGRRWRARRDSRHVFHHGVSMSLRLATANEKKRGHDFSRAAAETHLQEALAAEGYPSALVYVSLPQGLKPISTRSVTARLKSCPPVPERRVFIGDTEYTEIHRGIRVSPCISVYSVAPW